METISDGEWRLLDRVDNLLIQREKLLSRIDEHSLIATPEPTFDRLGKLSTRVDFRKRWTNATGRRVMRRVSVRISEIRGGYSFTQFMGGRAVYVANARGWIDLQLYQRVMLLN